MLFFWLDTVELAIERVQTRVSEGGHDIPEDVIRRRYNSGIKNLFKLYIPICDYWMLFDNSNPEIKLIAEGNQDNEINIENNLIFEELKNKQ